MTKDLADELRRTIEGILFKRAIQQRIDGYVLETAEEIAVAVSALRGEQWQGIETVVAEARDAIAFLDRVRAASSDEQIAVGQDHWNRVEAALRSVAALPPKGTSHE